MDLDGFGLHLGSELAPNSDPFVNRCFLENLEFETWFHRRSWKKLQNFPQKFPLPRVVLKNIISKKKVAQLQNLKNKTSFLKCSLPKKQF